MFIRLRCFEKSPENQRNALKRANRRRMADPRAPQQGSSAMWVGHGRASQTQGLGHPMAEPQKGQGTPCWVPDSLNGLKENVGSWVTRRKSHNTETDTVASPISHSHCDGRHGRSPTL